MTTKTADQIAAEARTQLAVLNVLKRTHRPDSDILRRTAELYVSLNHQWQQARYGRIRRGVTVAQMLR